MFNAFRSQRGLMRARCTAVLAWLLFAGTATAATAVDLNRAIDFNIEVQKLSTALLEFSQQASVQILTATEIVTDLNAPAVRGRMVPTEAIAKLLQGTKLKFHVVGTNAIAIDSEQTTAQNTSPGTGEEGAQREGEGTPLSPEGRGVGGEGNKGQGPLKGIRLSQNDQDPSSSSSTEELEKLMLQEVIVVTGTNIRGAAPVGSPLIVYSRKQIEESGRGSVAEFVETIPQNFAGDGSDSGIQPGYGDTNNLQGASGLNLRGLGTAGTLVLLNGRRLAPSVLGDFVDVSAIPLGAVDRIEVLPDGASAIYGSDAVAGVVNFVLRKNYEGAETRIRNGWLAGGNAQDLDVNQAFGTAWSSGSLFLAANYQDRDALDARDRDYAQVPAPFHLEPEKQSASAVASLVQRLNDRTALQVDAFYSKAHVTQLQTLAFLPTSRALIKPEQYSGNVSLQVDLGHDWTTEGTVSYANSNYERKSTFSGLAFADTYRAKVRTAELKVDGTIFTTAAGAAAIAAGVGARSEDYHKFSSLFAAFGFPSTNVFSRDVTTAFAELNLPIISSENPQAWARRLSVSLAVRYEDYTDAGNTVDPKVGLLWRPIDSLGLRASYGTSFNTARYAQTDINFNTPSIRDIPSTACGSSVCRVIADLGNREEYKPETSESFSLGFDFTPIALPGFWFTAGYYDIRYEDRIGSLPSIPEILASAGQFPTVATSNPSAAFVQDYVDRCAQTFNCFNEVGVVDPSTVNYYLDMRTTNLGKTRTRGIDAGMGYRWQAGPGEWHADFGGTHVLKFTNQLTSISVPFDGIDRVGFPAATRVRAGLGYSNQSYSIDGSVNYTGSYVNDMAIPNASVSSWFTADMRVLLPLDQWFSGIGTDVSLNVKNIFNSDPPDVFDGFFPIGFDPTNANPDGRVVSLEVVKRWGRR